MVGGGHPRALFLPPQFRQRFELEIERMKQMHQKDHEDKEEELEDVRQSCQRRVREPRTQLRPGVPARPVCTPRPYSTGVSSASSGSAVEGAGAEVPVLVTTVLGLPEASELSSIITLDLYQEPRVPCG